jgi:hypothetical protein
LICKEAQRKKQNISKAYLSMPGRSLSTNLAATLKTYDFHPQEIFLAPICIKGYVDSRALFYLVTVNFSYRPVGSNMASVL